MISDFLEFEEPIEGLYLKVKELRSLANKDSNTDLLEEIESLEEDIKSITKKIFSNLSPWQVTQLARHPNRPHSMDYVDAIFTDFTELKGDRLYGDDSSIIAGIGKIEKIPVVIIGHQKGRKTSENLLRNFGMSSPEGYRKANRVMRLAEKFSLPIVTFIDTPGAHPGLGAEERGQSQAIAENLKLISTLKVPVICNVIGEGGSGGALAIGVGDSINMLEHSIYSVISPEGCASILWKDSSKAELAAKNLALTSERLLNLGIIDSIVYEPLGGAHRDYGLITQRVKSTILNDLNILQSMPVDVLLESRRRKILSYTYNDIELAV